jgi:hypothetical protein
MLSNNESRKWLITYGFMFDTPSGSTIKEATYTVDTQLDLDAWKEILDRHANLTLIDVAEVMA